MKPKSDFYIGWQDALPSDHRSSLRRFVIGLFAIMILVVCIMVLAQNPFASSKYEIGNIIEEEGYLYTKPRPTLVQVDAEGRRSSILLVSYGKIGADEDLQNWFGDHPEVDQGVMVKISGTDATYNDETVMELTFKDQSIELLDRPPSGERKVEELGFKELQGEIIDPKCFFGAMKPGEGKIHRSCAIRCLSGGIPPVLAADDGYYYTIQLPFETSVSEIFDVVAKPISIDGTLKILDGSRFLYVSESSLAAIQSPTLLDEDVAYCRTVAVQ